MARTKRERPPDPDRLVRRSAGHLQSEDGRFEVSSAGGAGRWYVTDTERHDQLGLALVLGPFGTLDEVRSSITSQRATPAGDDGPLPQPSALPEPRPRRRGRRDGAVASPATGPETQPGSGQGTEPEPEPGSGQGTEPEPPPRPPVRISRGRWRPRRDARDEVVAVVRRVEDAWLSGDPDAMTQDLHESVVYLPPEPGSRLEGRGAAVGSYRALVSGAIVTAFIEQELSVDVVGATAVARYRFELAWEADGRTHQDTGHELLVLTLEDDRWLVAWRTTLPE